MFNPFAGPRIPARILAAELRAFGEKGLRELEKDLQLGRVGHSWSNCVISYREGGAGSARGTATLLGRYFIRAWDWGVISADEVLVVVRAELARRGLRPVTVKLTPPWQPTIEFRHEALSGWKKATTDSGVLQ